MRLMTPTGRLASVGACRTPTTPSSKVAQMAEKAAWEITRGPLRSVVRALLIQRASGNVTDCTYEQEICR
jgi:hypothetical protein